MGYRDISLFNQAILAKHRESCKASLMGEWGADMLVFSTKLY